MRWISSLALLVLASRAASAQSVLLWPFPDSLNVAGTVTATIQSHQHYDNPPPGTKPDEYGVGKGTVNFPFLDSLLNRTMAYRDGEGWHIRRSVTFKSPEVDLASDTVLQRSSMRIKSHYVTGFSIDELVEINLENLSASTDSIYFRDEDIDNYLRTFSYSYQSGHSNSYYQASSTEPYRLSLFGHALYKTFRSAARIEYGEVPIGTSKDTAIMLVNSNSSPLRLGSYTVSMHSGGYSTIDTQRHVIPPHDSGVVIVRFTSSLKGLQQDTLTFETDQTFNSTRPIALSGYSPYSDLRLPKYPGDMQTPIDNVTSEFVPLWNLGLSDATVAQYSITGSGRFVVDSPAVGYVVGPGDTVILRVSFAPTSVGYQEAQLVVRTQAGDSASTILKGTAQPRATVRTETRSNRVQVTEANGEIHIQSLKPADIILYDVCGRIFLFQRATASGDFTMTGLRPGMYSAFITTQGDTPSIARFVVP